MVISLMSLSYSKNLHCLSGNYGAGLTLEATAKLQGNEPLLKVELEESIASSAGNSLPVTSNVQPEDEEMKTTSDPDSQALEVLAITVELPF